MTKNDYIAIAAAIKESAETWHAKALRENTALLLCAGSIADIMAEDNPRFDRDKFLKECGF